MGMVNSMVDLGPANTGGKHLVPVVIFIQSPVVNVEHARVPVPPFSGENAVEIAYSSLSVRVLTSGSPVMQVRNPAGNVLISYAIGGAGVTVGNVQIDTLAIGDHLRFGFTNIGVGLADVCCTVWLKLPTLA